MNVEGSIKFSIVERSADRVVSEMPIIAGMKNPYGGVHAGAILWFADVTASILVLGPGGRRLRGMKGFPGHKPQCQSCRQPDRGDLQGHRFIREAGPHGERYPHRRSWSRRQADRGRHYQPCPLEMIPDEVSQAKALGRSSSHTRHGLSSSHASLRFRFRRALLLPSSSSESSSAGTWSWPSAAGVARSPRSRCTTDRRDNFELPPEWLAQHNKAIFGRFTS